MSTLIQVNFAVDLFALHLPIPQARAPFPSEIGLARGCDANGGADFTEHFI